MQTHCTMFVRAHMCLRGCVRRMWHTLIPRETHPLNTPNHGCVWRWPGLVPEGFGACLFPRPQLLLRPVMNALSWAAEHQALGPQGALRTLISAVIGGNWKLSVPVGQTGGPQAKGRLVELLVVVLYHTCGFEATGPPLSLITFLHWSQPQVGPGLQPCVVLPGQSTWDNSIISSVDRSYSRVTALMWNGVRRIQKEVLLFGDALIWLF